jgi:hypothetical protein
VVPGVLNTDVFKLGRVVDAKSHQDDIPSGSQLNLPLWLVESLATMVLEATPAGGRSARFFVDVQAPNAFSPVAVEDMHADAGAARIRSSTRYYYDVGMKLGALGRLQGNEELMQIVEADTEGEGSFLVKVFKARFCSLLAEAHIVPEDTRMKMQNKLTREEFDLFDKANANYIAFERWILSSGTRIKAPVTSRKRRQGQEGGARAKSARSGDGAALVPGLA